MSSGHTERIDALLRSSRSASEPELKAVLGRLSSEIKERLNNGTPSSGDFFLSALRSLLKIRGNANAEVRLACLVDCVAYLFSNRQDVEALEAAKACGALASSYGDKRWIRKAKTIEGIAYSHIGHAAEAILSYSAALAIARELEDPEAEVAVLCNLGNALNYGGLYREAIPCLSKAAALSRQISDTSQFEAPILCNLAQSYFFLEEHAAAFSAIAVALKKSVEPQNAMACFFRAVRELTFVQIAVELGKLESARQHAKICHDYAIRSGIRRGEYVAGIAEGLCEIHGGDVQKGLTALERALVSSGEAGTPQYTAALGALIKGYEQAGRPEEALEGMRILMASIRAAREKGVLALVSQQAQAMPAVIFTSEKQDLVALHYREAELRAQVAERAARNTRIEMLERMATTGDLKEESSGEHGLRVGRLSSLMANELAWSHESCGAIDVAGRLHDLGKIAMPDRILLSSDALKEAERHFISTHTLIGAELLAKSNIPQLRMAEEIARHHHEWWNGEGYPSKLKGKRIPIHARIVALADVFDALTHGRPFSAPWGMDRAIEDIAKRKGSQFDPELTEVFLALIERLRNEHDDLDEYLGRAGRNSPFLQARNKIRLMLAEERENVKKTTVDGNQTCH